MDVKSQSWGSMGSYNGVKDRQKKMQETKMCLLLSKRHAKNNFSISFNSVVILLDKTKFLWKKILFFLNKQKNKTKTSKYIFMYWTM